MHRQIEVYEAAHGSIGYRMIECHTRCHSIAIGDLPPGGKYLIPLHRTSWTCNSAVGRSANLGLAEQLPSRDRVHGVTCSAGPCTKCTRRLYITTYGWTNHIQVYSTSDHRQARRRRRREPEVGYEVAIDRPTSISQITYAGSDTPPSVPLRNPTLTLLYSLVGCPVAVSTSRLPTTANCPCRIRSGGNHEWCVKLIGDRY